jgi:arylsulfatase
LKKTISIFAIATACTLFLVHSSGCHSRKPVDTNLILITIDTLRADHLGCYGYPRDTSPSVDGLAKQSVVFTHCVTQATATAASHASIFTSLYPPAHGVTHNSLSLSPEIPSLIGVLEKNNYRTGAFVSSIVMGSLRGLDQGFQIYDDILESRELNREDAYERPADLTTSAALDWIQYGGNKRFFAWIHYIDPHGAYYPPEQYRGLFVGDQWYREGDELPAGSIHYPQHAIPAYQILSEHRDPAYYVAQYDAEIRFVDDQVGRLLRHLEEAGLLSNTVIVITSDHGETLAEREYYFSHGIRTYDDQALIPLIMYFPDRAQHTEISAQVRAIDIMPTVLDRLGVGIDATVHGQSLMPLVRGDDDYSGGPALIFSESGKELYDVDLGSQRSLRTPKRKYIRNSRDETEELYNLEDDPLERTNLAATDSMTAAEMGKLFDAQARGIQQAKTLERKHSEEEIKKMESLGYIVK